MEKRESLGSRLGFILLSAGCAIGLGNVWKFPNTAATNGGAIFILVYLLFLVIFGLPIMTMEFSVGRASRKSIAASFRALEPQGTKWHSFGFIGVAGNYLLMMFYTTVTGWMFAYFFKMIKGDFAGKSVEAVKNQFDALIGDPIAVIGFMVLAVVLGLLICSLGLEKGVEKITKIMMVALLAIISILAINVLTLDGAMDGLEYYLVPNFERMKANGVGIGDVITAALGQSFFTLSIGMGSMAIFGSYISKERRLFGESISIAALDTFVAFMSGLIIIPACFAFGFPFEQIEEVAGPGLIFKILPNVFNQMPLGQVWGSLFFLFLIFAALSTVVAVFENIISFGMELGGWSRKKSCLINLVLIIVLSIPCALGFNVLSGFNPLGEGTVILDLEDFIISNNILPLGSLVYVLFCTSKKFGWGWNNFLEEANAGKGIGFPKWLKIYCKYILPIILFIFWIQGYITMFFS